MQKYYNHIAYGIYLLGARLHHIKTNNPKIYNYYNKKGEFAIQCEQDDQIDNKLYFSMEKADNNELISELEENIKDLKKDKILSQDIVFKCNQCNKTACVFELFFTTADDNETLFEIKTNAFISQIGARFLGEDRVSIENFGQIKNNLNNLSKLNKLNHDLFGFICKKCNKAYCSKCWKIVAISYDEGFYEDTQAICPNSHKQVIDD
jgi:hypothetical protein